MAVFVLSAKKDDAQLNSNIATLPPSDVLKFDTNQWLVSANMTARQLCEQLGITKRAEGTTGLPAIETSAAVFNISGYFGRHTTEMWEWLKLKMEKA